MSGWVIARDIYAGGRVVSREYWSGVNAGISENRCHAMKFLTYNKAITYACCIGELKDSSEWRVILSDRAQRLELRYPRSRLRLTRKCISITADVAASAGNNDAQRDTDERQRAGANG